MDTQRATDMFSALGQETRLEVLRLLVQAGEAGLAAGQIGEALCVRQNTMSANLSVLMQAGLIRNVREGRSIRYFAHFEGIRAMLSFLMEDCCGGQSAQCQPLLDTIVCGC